MSTESESLSSILSGSSAVASSAPEPAKAEPAVDVKPEVVETKPEPAAPSAATGEPEKGEPSRDDKGRFAPKTEAKPEKAEPMVPLSALLAERAKRRDPEAPQKPKTSVLENEDQAFSERLAEHTAPLKEAVFSMSVEFARSRFDDFDEVAEVFSNAANKDERLWQQMRSAANPAMYVYQVGKQVRELAPFGGDVSKYREHALSETKAELAKRDERIKALEAEVAAMKNSKAQLESVPRSLNSAGAAAQPTVADADPGDLSKIVRFGNK